MYLQQAQLWLATAAELLCCPPQLVTAAYQRWPRSMPLLQAVRLLLTPLLLPVLLLQVVTAAYQRWLSSETRTDDITVVIIRFSGLENEVPSAAALQG